ncbi:MAG: prolipoprotein diacylglyceryl transferase [Defluviimonas denitrificans]
MCCSTSQSLSSHPLEVLKVWEGGMSFHGGFLGVVVAGLWFCRRYGAPPMQVADAMALVAPVGLFLGRIANFINAELWGRRTDLPWGVVFPARRRRIARVSSRDFAPATRASFTKPGWRG